MIVKVTVPTHPEQAQARIVSSDGKMEMFCPIALARRRLHTASIGFFKAEIESGALELGDRIPDQNW